MKKTYLYRGQTIARCGNEWGAIGADHCVAVYVSAKTLKELREKIDERIKRDYDHMVAGYYLRKN